jgi:two-component system sensor histidine kinase CpxA
MKMRGLFLKIFAIFWLAQSLIFVISTTLIVRQRFPGSNTLADALDSSLQHDAQLGIRDFDAGGCAGFANNAGRHEPSGAMLLQMGGEAACSTSAALSLPEPVARFPNRVEGRQVGSRYVWLVPVTAHDGSRYEYVWFQPPALRQERRPSLLRYAFPQLPVAIAVGGLTTFVLVLLLSRPLVRLRRAARALAEGNLAARVEVSPAALARSHSDEFQGLVHDFNHMAERLESLVGAQRLLLRDVSHELRSPLARLSVALELAREDAGPALETHLGRIEREGEKLNQLIGELLALSSMESLDAASAFQSVSLNELCEQLLPDAAYEAQHRPCTVVLEQDAECAVRGDWNLLYRAIENVVRNAIRYTEAGTQVTVRVRKGVSDGSEMAVVEVRDHGPGVPESEVGHIFRPFYRLDHARSAGTGGFGVGLAITERAIRLHGGSVRAVREESGGTRIEMEFPMREER